MISRRTGFRFVSAITVLLAEGAAAVPGATLATAPRSAPFTVESTMQRSSPDRSQPQMSFGGSIGDKANWDLYIQQTDLQHGLSVGTDMGGAALIQLPVPRVVHSPTPIFPPSPNSSEPAIVFDAKDCVTFELSGIKYIACRDNRKIAPGMPGRTVPHIGF